MMGASSRSSVFSVSRLLYAAVPDMLLLRLTCVQSPSPGLYLFTPSKNLRCFKYLDRR